MSLTKKYGKWALVSGASAGIGEAFCFGLAKVGFSIVLLARRKEKMEEIAQKLRENFGVETLVLETDLTKEGFIEQVQSATENLEIGFLVSNAGFGKGGNFWELDGNLMAEMVKLNCLASTILISHFAKRMVLKKRGAIISISSVVAYQPTPFYAVYSATKAFNLILGESLWYELREKGIDSLVVSPGSTKSEFRKVAGMPENPNGMEASEVVKIALANIGKKSSVAAGFVNKLPQFFARIFPREFWIRIVGKISEKRIKNNG